MNQSNPNSEPTMDEILASIRKIISEDQPEAEQEQKAQGESSLQMPEPELPPEPPPEPTIEEPLAADLSEPIGVVEEEPVRLDTISEVDDSVAFSMKTGPDDVEEILPENYSKEAPIDDKFISSTTRDALDQAFDQIEADPALAPVAAASDGSIEAVFTRAVQEAFDPTLQEWVDNHGEEIVSRLSPLIREWMDENLPPLVEAAVTKEISRAVRSRRR